MDTKFELTEEQKKSKTDPAIQSLYKENVDLVHAIQTGVKYEQELGSEDGSPKHLRTGVNYSMNQIGSMIELLIEKGIFTRKEYLEKENLMLKMEVERYEARISEMLNGQKVSLS